MSEKRCGWIVLRWTRELTIAGAIGLIVVSGCESGPFDEDRFMRLQVDPKRVREVEPLQLDALDSPVDEAQPPDPAEYARHLAAAPEQLELALAEARAIALDHNLDLQVELLSPAIARERISEEEAQFESLFFANMNSANTDTPTSSTLSGSQVNSYSADAGVRIPLRTGGSITLDAPFNRVETNNIFSTLNPAYETDLSLSFAQPLLRNAGVRTNTHAIRLARYQSKAAQARAKLQVINVLTTVDRVYWRLSAAREELKVRKQEYDLAVAQLERARRLVDAGAAAEVEVIRAESGVAERVEAIIIAENAVRDRERELKRVLNQPDLDVGSRTIIIPETGPDLVRYEIDPHELANVALDARMEMLELEIQLAQDSSTIDFARNQALPLVNLTYTYNVNGLGSAWSDSLDLLGDKDFEDHVFGVQVEVPVGNEGAESRLRQAILTRLQTLATRRQRAVAIRQEVFNAVDQIEANLQRVLAARRSVALAERTLRAEERQFELGLRTSTEVFDAQTRYANAQLSLIQALSEYEIAKVDLAFATGFVLGASSVRWAPADPPAHLDIGSALPQIIN